MNKTFCNQEDCGCKQKSHGLAYMGRVQGLALDVAFKKADWGKAVGMAGVKLGRHEMELLMLRVEYVSWETPEESCSAHCKQYTEKVGVWKDQSS